MIMSVFVGAGNGQGLPGQSTHKVTKKNGDGKIAAHRRRRGARAVGTDEASGSF